MIKKREFIERTIYLIKELLEKYLPEEDTLSDMVTKRNRLLHKFMK